MEAFSNFDESLKIYMATFVCDRSVQADPYDEEEKEHHEDTENGEEHNQEEMNVIRQFFRFHGMNSSERMRPAFE